MNCKSCKTPQINHDIVGFEQIDDTEFNIIYDDPPATGNIKVIVKDGSSQFILTNENSGLAQGSIDHDASSVINSICADNCLVIGNVVKLADLTVSGLEGITGGNLIFQENGESGDMIYTEEDPNLLLPGVKATDSLGEDAYGIVVGGDFDGVYGEGLQSIVNNFSAGVIVAFLRDGVRVCTQGRCLALADGSGSTGQGLISIGDELTSSGSGLVKAPTTIGTPIIAKALQAASTVNSIIAVDVQRIAGFGLWAFKKQLSVDPANVTPAPDSILSDFPLLVSITDTDLKESAASNGFDIYFTKSDGTTRLPYERESYDPITGTLVAWVLTDLSDTDENNFFMFYGNPGAPDQQNPSPVWAARSYNDVFHFNQSSPLPWLNSSIGKDFTVSNGPTSPTPVGGQIDTASNISFDSTSSAVSFRMPDTESITPSDVFVSMWIKFDTISTQPFASLRCWQSNVDFTEIAQIIIGSGFQGLVPDNEKIVLTIFDDLFNEVTLIGDMADLAYHHVAVRYTSGSPSSFDLFFDGSFVSSVAHDFFEPLTFNISECGGLAVTTASPQNGRIDELQVAYNSNFSDGFIKTSFDNQNDAGQGAGNFVNVGPQQPAN